MKTALLSFLAAILLAAPTAFAQSGGHDHSSHDGHNHAPAPGKNVKLPAIDHVLTEAPDDHVIGSDTAPITLIAYASVTCPHCGEWFSKDWPKFKADHIDTGDVRFIMREFPTQPEALAHAGFAIINCAPDGEYFDHLVHQMKSQEHVFAAMKTGEVEPVYQGFATKAGMPTQADMYACFDRPEIGARIERSLLRARHGKITGVPSFFLDGMIVANDLSAEGLSKLVTEKLNNGMTTLPNANMVRGPIPMAPKPKLMPTPEK